METQKLVSQFKIEFAGPIAADMQVEREIDLLSLSYNYEHKLVWVKETKAMYFLRSGYTGHNIDDWKMYGKNFLSEWTASNEYDIYECVYDQHGIYIALQNVPAGTLLTKYEYWLKVSTNVVTIYREFENVSYIEIPTLQLGIEHPLFQVYINNKSVGCEIERVQSGDNEVWRVSFYEEGVLTPKTGYVVIK